ncbi:MAG: thioredoxin [Bacteroidota bacterium]|jgi:thioredoxin 1
MKASFTDLITSESPILVDFHADWCGPCKMLAPVLKEVKAELGSRIRIVKIDVDRNTAIASQYQVRGVPTLILFKSGQAVWRQSGVLSAQAIIQAINPYL